MADLTDERPHRDVAEEALKHAVAAHPAEAVDPITALVTRIEAQLRDEEGESGPGLAYTVCRLSHRRPDDVAPAVEPVVEAFEDAHEMVKLLFVAPFADIALHYPDELVCLAEDVVGIYTARDWESEDVPTNVAVTLSYLAMEQSDRARDACEEFLARDESDCRPASNLIRLALDDWRDTVAADWVAPESNGGLADLVSESDPEVRERVCRLLGDLEYEPAADVLATVERESDSARLSEIAKRARHRL